MKQAVYYIWCKIITGVLSDGNLPVFINKLDIKAHIIKRSIRDCVWQEKFSKLIFW